MSAFKRYLPVALILFVSFVFIQSLFFKFSDAPETQHIFGTLNAWVTDLGAPGLFAKNGIFSQYLIGAAELVTSTVLLASLTDRFAWLRRYGAALGLAIMSGAISFHLFTPLGVDVQDDGGLLFIMACVVWLACAYLLFRAWRPAESATL